MIVHFQNKNSVRSEKYFHYAYKNREEHEGKRSFKEKNAPILFQNRN